MEFSFPVGKKTFSIIAAFGSMPMLHDLVIVKWQNMNFDTPETRFRAQMLTLCLLSFYLVFRLMPTPPPRTIPEESNAANNG
jgi:hypothetical protein